MRGCGPVFAGLLAAPAYLASAAGEMERRSCRGKGRGKLCGMAAGCSILPPPPADGELKNSGAGHDAAAVVQATAQGIVAMAKLGWWGTFWLNRFSQPASDRSIYRQVQATIPRRVLEIGLGTLVRAERLLSLLQTIGPEEGVQYVGLDRFEGRLPGDPPGVTLKQAHQRLRPLARVQLWPGSADTSLSRLCNHLGLFDLVLVSADNEPQHLQRSWFFIQRVVNAQTTILVETAAKTGGGATLWQPLEKSHLDSLAARTLNRRAA